MYGNSEILRFTDDDQRLVSTALRAPGVSVYDARSGRITLGFSGGSIDLSVIQVSLDGTGLAAFINRKPTAPGSEAPPDLEGDSDLAIWSLMLDQEVVEADRQRSLFRILAPPTTPKEVDDQKVPSARRVAGSFTKPSSGMTQALFRRFDPSGRLVVSLESGAGNVQYLKVGEADTGILICSIPGSYPIPGWGSLAVHPRGEQVALIDPRGAAASRRIVVLDVNGGKSRFEVNPFRSGLWEANGISYSADGRWILAWIGNPIAELAVLDAADGSERLSLNFPSRIIRLLAMSPNGHHLAIVETMPQLVGGFPQTMIHVVDLASGKEICKPTITGDVESLAFDQSGRYVAASHYSQPLGTGVVHVWALPNGREVFSSPPALDAHYSNLTFNVIGTQISLNSSRRSSDAPAEHVFVWDLPSGQARLQSPGADVADLYFRSDGHLAVLSTSGEIKMLRVHQSRE